MSFTAGNNRERFSLIVLSTGSRFEYFKGTFICRSDTYGGNSIYNNIRASNLADFIDKKIEYSENYEQMLQQEYTPEEIEFYKHIEQVVII